MARLHDVQAELAHQDAAEQDHPHPRNCVLNLVVMVDERHRVEACDRLIANLAASHPLRAILVHLRGGSGRGALDVEITSEAHQLVSGFPVQREQILLHVRGKVTNHLSSLVEPLLVSDVPTYLWWSGRDRLDEATIHDAMTFSDVLVVDSARFEHPVQALLELAELVADPSAGIGVADFRWGRMRPLRDAIAQFFAPHDRRALLPALHEVTLEGAGAGPEARVGAALIAGWMASALDWRLTSVTSTSESTQAVAETGSGQPVRLTLQSTANERLRHGELLTTRLSGHRGRHTFALTAERDRGGDPYARVTIDLEGRAPLLQRVALPRIGDPELLVHVLWSDHRDPLFHGALRAATPLLEAMR
jgi:glucose-6-phosphate dehydrogenase assembly protein OpcA